MTNTPIIVPSCPHADEQAPLKHRLIQLFWTIGPAFTRWAESHMHEPDLTPQRVRVLLHLKQYGSSKMSDLRDALGVTATNVTALVDTLEKDKMVQRLPHPSDRRATIIAITEYAQQRLMESCGEFKDSVSELFGEFSQAEQEQFVQHLSRMYMALVQRGVLEMPTYPNAVKPTPEKQEETA